jgi:hypothetical protein
MMCSGRECELRGKCYRYLANPSKWQSMFAETPMDKKTGKCTEFWKCPSKSEKKRLDVLKEEFPKEV